MSKTVEMNMLRDRATPLPVVTEEMFKSCNPHNVGMVEEYLELSNNLSRDTLKQYRSGLYQFVYYIYENLNDKPFYKITKRDFKRYMSYLTGRGLSSNALKFKKSAVSAFCGKFLENIVAEEDDDYSTFRNFTNNVGDIPKNQVYNKLPITEAEYKLMMETLEADENYLGMAWVAVMFNVGCRRSGCIQFKSEIVNYKMEEGTNYVMSHIVREKGRSTDGKPCEYMINEEALKYIKLWLEKRGYEHEYIFTIKHRGEVQQMSRGWANRFCEDVLSDIVGRRINVHIFKASCITYLLEKGVDMKLVSKYVAQHESIETTDKFYNLTDDTEARKKIFS